MLVSDAVKVVTSREKRYCTVCGMYIVKKKNASWKAYGERKFCGVRCGNEGKRSVNKINVNGTDKSEISDYIALKSRNGRKMADFNLGILDAVENISDDADLGTINRNGKYSDVICTYKGVPVTGELVRSANQWLMDNWMGRPGQRESMNKEPELTREEVDAQIAILLENG